MRPSHSIGRGLLIVFFCTTSVAEQRGGVPPPPKVPVVVVGAGLTGLTTAYQLRKAGIDVRVLESNPRSGGRIQTVAFPDGTRVEAHMEEYWEA